MTKKNNYKSEKGRKSKVEEGMRKQKKRGAAHRWWKEEGKIIQGSEIEGVVVVVDDFFSLDLLGCFLPIVEVLDLCLSSNFLFIFLFSFLFFFFFSVYLYF